jgi:hypothetical protein
MPRVVRGQLALETGERLRDLASKISHLGDYGGEALAMQLRQIDSTFGAQLQALDIIVKSCRTAKNSYPNYPALRSALGEAGEQVYEIRGAVADLRGQVFDNRRHALTDLTYLHNRLLEISQQLRLVQFVPHEGGKAAVNG